MLRHSIEIALTPNILPVLDVRFESGISDPIALERDINNLPGVLENGLFVNLADEVLVGEINDGVAGVRSLERVA